METDPELVEAVAAPLPPDEEDAASAEEEEEESVVKAVPNLDLLNSSLREIGREAICWQLSSAKPGNGVEQIRDPSIETYWQSDGNSQPHWIQIHFARRVGISHVCLYLDYNLDESYTPRKLMVQFGMTAQDLNAGTTVEVKEPSGWCIIPLVAPPDPLDDEGTETIVKAHLIRISILSMHQNGRDTHVRQVQLFGPRMNAKKVLRSKRVDEQEPFQVTQFATIR